MDTLKNQSTQGTPLKLGQSRDTLKTIGTLNYGPLG